MITKLAAYGFSYESLNFIQSYLTDRKQKICINHAYSSNHGYCCNMWRPQGSLLRPFLFSTDICDMFLLNNSFVIASYADDNTLHISGPSKDLVKNKSEMSRTNLFKWSRENYMKSSPDKCHLLDTARNPVQINTECHINYWRTDEKLLSVKFDSHLLFERRLKKKPSQKLHALLRIKNQMHLEKRKCSMKTFIIS